MLLKIYRFIFNYLIYKLFIYKSDGRFTIINPIVCSYKHLSIGNKVYIRNHARIEAVVRYNKERFSPLIEFNKNVSIEQNLHLTCANSIKIGANTSISSNVSITDINHPYENINLPPDSQNIEVGSVIIGQNCKIYNNVVVLPNATLGNHCVVGANSVVIAGNYPDYSIIVGSPAKIVKHYCFETKKWTKK